MFRETKVGALFPSHIWLHHLDRPEVMNARLAEKILAMKESEPSQSKYAGMWQSKGNFHTLGEMAALKAAMEQAVAGVIHFKAWADTAFAITDCWANVNRDDFSLYEHSHPNNFISGTYYVRAPKDCGDLIFHDPRPAAQVMIPAVKSFTPHNSQKHRVTPEEGLLVLFESWLPHSVDANTCGTDRISIAFNATLTGKVGYPSGRARVAGDQSFGA